MIRYTHGRWPLRSSRPPESAGSGSAPTSAHSLVFRCLYCDRDKPKSDSTLEHAIPQFLGGAHAPMHYKLRNVCERCNSILGLHVDASYARSWTATNGLAMAARKLYTGPGQIPLPLVCMGLVNDMPGLTVPEGMAAELWFGPSGESIVWIRSESDVMYWYSGGNPIDKKTKPSTLYYLPTAGDPVGFHMGMEAFKEAFKKAKARRIFGAELVGAPAGTLFPGFDDPTEAERANLEAIRQANVQGQIHAQARMNLRFDDRFICKMVLAVGYSLFGEIFLGTEIATQARLGLWPKADQPPPELRGVGSFAGGADPRFAAVSGYPGAVAIVILRVGDQYAMTVSVDQKMPFTVGLAPATLQSPKIPEHGYALLLFPQLRLPVELELPTLLAHRLKSMVHPELAHVDAKAIEAQAFNDKLPPLPTRPAAPMEVSSGSRENQPPPSS